MNGFSHFYPRYGLALAMSEKAALAPENLTVKDFSEILEHGLLHFRMKAVGDWRGKEKIEFGYERLQEGKAANGIYLTPTVISTDKNNMAKKLWVKIEEFRIKLDDMPPKEKQTKKQPEDWRQKKESAKQSFAPTAGDYNNGKATRRQANIPFLEAICCAITTSTTDKPAFTHIEKVGEKTTVSNTTILPDLPLNDLRAFINVFKEVSKFKAKGLFYGRVKDGKPTRPAISRGNFPNAPKSNALRALGLLGAIGEWAKESDDTGLAAPVLQSLENCPIYLVSPEDTKITGFNHYVVALARENRLNSIIDSIYYVAPFSLNRNSDFKEREREREKVAFFAARFLHLFDEMSFREFLAVRAEYPGQLEILFKTFFMEKKQIDPNWVTSAKSLGAWVNMVAYRAAKADVEKDTRSQALEPKRRAEKIREVKAKFLVQIESSGFSAKSGPALISQVITQVGRLFDAEAPPEASLFMEKTMSGELDLRDAQQMLMAFSRLRNKFEAKTAVPEEEDLSDDSAEESEDFSDAQDND